MSRHSKTRRWTMLVAHSTYFCGAARCSFSSRRDHHSSESPFLFPMRNARTNRADMRLTKTNLRGRRRELRQAVQLSASENRTDLFGGPASATSRRHAGVGEMRSDGGELRTRPTQVGNLVHDLDLAWLRIEATINIALIPERHGTETDRGQRLSCAAGCVSAISTMGYTVLR